MLLLSAVVLILNLYILDYQGPREETKTSLGVVALFLVLITASAFTGHSGAEKGNLNLTFLSLVFLIVATLHWSIVATVSMTKGNDEAINMVCIQLRCPETLWTINLGFRNYYKPTIQTNMEENLSGIKQLAYVTEASSLNKNKFFDRKSSDNFLNDLVSEEDEENIGFKRKSQKKEELVFNSITFLGHSVDEGESAGIAFAAGLLLLLVIFSYFMSCATVICSYAAELYESSKDYLEEEEENDDLGHE